MGVGQVCSLHGEGLLEPKSFDEQGWCFLLVQVS